MAAVCRYSTDTQENMEVSHSEPGGIHERLVAYVHSLQHGSRRGVWGEHSYARARHAGTRGSAAHARSLLAPRVPGPPSDLIDVDSPPTPPPSPPAEPALRVAAPVAPPAAAAPPDEDDPAEEEEWEARVASLAPSVAHARLAAAAVATLRTMRLERLVSVGAGVGGLERARGQARAAARRLRRALASAWLTGGGSGGGAPAWLHAALLAYLPPSSRSLYEEAVGELRRRVPRLAERLTGSWAPPPAEPNRAIPGPVGPDSDPWLVWVSSGCGSLDARWERRLAALVHTRVLRPPRDLGLASPEAWCAAAAGAVRSSLTDALAEAGSRSIILGGLGAGASLCLLLARGAGGAGGAAGGVRGAVLAAPALRTAEGGRGARDDALAAVRLPLLLVVGTHAADSSRSIANELCESAGGVGARRVLEVVGADAQLRVPRRVRTRLALPQYALDAALVEECVRWAVETAEGEEPESPRRRALPSIVHQIDLDAADEYAHLPAAATSPPPPVPSTPTGPGGVQNRSIEIVEGRVVSRSAGCTPLTLMPPRRAPAPTPSPAPEPHDIMQMPIVFADDNAGPSPSPSGSPVTVTSGKARVSGDAGAGGPAPSPSVKMTRVIVAKRGGRATVVPAPAAPLAKGLPSVVTAARGGGGVRAGVLTRGGGGARRVLLRRGIRLVPREGNH